MFKVLILEQGADSSIRRVNAEQEMDRTSDVRGRHEKSGYEKRPKDMQEMKIQDNKHEDIKVGCQNFPL